MYCLEFVQDREVGREPADAAELVFGEPAGGLVLKEPGLSACQCKVLNLVVSFLS